LPSATEQKTGTANISYTIRPPIPPEVSFTTLTNNATVSGTKAISANATDDKSVNRVEFYIDGVKKHTDYGAPYTWSWDTTSYSEGTHTVKVVAYDGDGKSSYQQYSVNVNNLGSSSPGISEGEGEDAAPNEGRLIIYVVVGVVIVIVVVLVSIFKISRGKPEEARG